MSWDPPSPAVAELIRTAAQDFLEAPEEVFAEVDAAVLSRAPDKLAADPALTAAITAANHENLAHWVLANVREPGVRVPPNVSPQVLDVARDIVRRGFDEASLNSYRVGQNVALRFWLRRMFELTSDPEVLRELLDVTTRSIFAFVDETIDGLLAVIASERDRLVRGTHAERLETVNLILENAPITAERASVRLGYELKRRHLAAVVWTEASPVEAGALERVADALARAAGARRPFTVAASAGALWVWVAGQADAALDGVRAALEDSPGVRVGVGTPGDGLDGFRRSHLDALATQRLMHRVPGVLRLASYEDVQVVALATHDEERATEFVARTLGALAHADPELRETLRVYLREESSASRAAKVLFSHRNTVLNRLGKAKQLLPAPLEGRGLQVALALEVVHWLGTT